MISSSAIKPKRQPVLSKSAQDRKDQLYVTLRKHPVLDPVIAIVDGYDKNVFVPYKIFKFKDTDRFIILTKPGSDETDPVDVSKRIAVYDVTPTSIRRLAINDVKSSIGDDALYTFVAKPGEIKIIDLDMRRIIIEGVPYDQQVSLEDGNVDALEKLKLVVPQTILDQLSFLSSPQQENPDRRLVSAVLRDDAPRIQHLINEEKIDPDSIDEKGVPMLVMAAKNGCLNAVKALVVSGANLESRSNDKDFCRTALLCAAVNKKENIVRFLVENGADVNAQDLKGDASLYYMSADDVPVALLDFMLAHGANPCLSGLGDKRPLENASLVTTRLCSLSEYHMNRDAEHRVEHWFYDEETTRYSIRFRQGLSHNDTLRAWNAIAKKIKSQLGYEGKWDDVCIFLKHYLHVTVNLSDSMMNAVLTLPSMYPHSDDVRAKHYVIQEIHGDQQGFTITLKDEYKSDLLVAKKLREIFAELKIKPAPLADAKISGNPAAMFTPPGLDVNGKPVLPQSNKLVI